MTDYSWANHAFYNYSNIMFYKTRRLPENGKNFLYTRKYAIFMVFGFGFACFLSTFISKLQCFTGQKWKEKCMTNQNEDKSKKLGAYVKLRHVFFPLFKIKGEKLWWKWGTTIVKTRKWEGVLWNSVIWA